MIISIILGCVIGGGRHLMRTEYGIIYLYRYFMWNPFNHHLILPFMYDAVASLLFVFSASVGLFLMVIRSSVWQNGVDSISVYNSRGHASE